MSVKPKVDGYNESKSGHGSQPSPKRFVAGFHTDAVVQLDAVEPATFTTSGNADGC